MEIKRHLLALLVLCPLLLAAGCASVPLASLEDDTKAKTFTVKSGKANIYVYRNETFGGAVSMTVALNGKVAGQTGAQTFFLWEVDPGPYEISSISEGTSLIKLTAEAGKSYFVWQEV